MADALLTAATFGLATFGVVFGAGAALLAVSLAAHALDAVFGITKEGR